MENSGEWVVKKRADVSLNDRSPVNILKELKNRMKTPLFGQEEHKLNLPVNPLVVIEEKEESLQLSIDLK